jgi:hypothetical protein
MFDVHQLIVPQPIANQTNQTNLNIFPSPFDKKNQISYINSSYQLEAKILNTQKVAITVPKNIIIMIDRISKSKGISRSKLISSMLEQKLSEEKYAYLRNAYDRVFDDDSIKEEQRSTAMWLENQGNEGGQEW